MSLKVDRGRTRARSQAFQILFQAEALDLPVDEVLAGDYLLSKGPLMEYAEQLARGCYAKLDIVDSCIAAVSENWSLYRMPAADRALLRIAVYELRCDDTDDKIEDAVVINEAVELAKAFGTDDSSRFVNGVLGRIARAEELPQAAPRVSEEDAVEAIADQPAVDDAACSDEAPEPVDETEE